FLQNNFRNSIYRLDFPTKDSAIFCHYLIVIWQRSIKKHTDSTMTNRPHWKIADLPWDQFDPARVEPELLAIIKAAALVEY
ncbi:hypothetical protein ABTL82_19965, partial [Acinetobacter baumannii]